MIYLFLLVFIYLITTSIAFYTTYNINQDIIDDISDEYIIKSSFYLSKDNSSILFLRKRLFCCFIPIIHFYIVNYNMNNFNYNKLYRNFKKRLIRNNRITKKVNYINNIDYIPKRYINNYDDMNVDEFEKEIGLSNIYFLNEKTLVYAKYLLYIYKRDKSKIDINSVIGKAEMIILDKYIEELEVLINNYEKNNKKDIKKKILSKNNEKRFHK